MLQRAQQPPVPFRGNLAIGLGDKKRVNSGLTWGVQFEINDNKNEPNKNELVDPSIASFTKFFPYDENLSTQQVMIGDNAGAADTAANGIIDADRFNNNLFTLERIQVSTGSTDKPIASRWGSAQYRRDGKLTGDLTDIDGSTLYRNDCTRFLDASKDFNHLPSKKYLKFTLFLQGGFDGVNIFDEDKAKLTNAAAKREYDDATNQGGVKGATIATYRKAIDVLQERSDSNIQLLAIPGLRHSAITDYAIEAVEDRFDALYIMDVEERDEINTVVTGSAAKIHVTNTVNSFEGRNLDSSFAAAYFPDVVITDPATSTNVQCPPSVAVLGAFSLNDAVAHPWFAPAGFTRGALSTVIESQVKLNRGNLDALYDADINPLTAFAHSSGVVVFGQKTLQAAQSALDRVNVRRLLIEVRRRVRRIGESLLFEPNREETLSRFSAAVNPVLQRIQQQQGLDRFRIQIDTTTTSQADVENNTIRGKIFLQPTRAVEFVSLDFVVTNQGAEI
jgi:phage tail sheath protein FI